MKNAPKSFDEFYSTIEDDILDVDTVAAYADRNRDDIGTFEGSMFCPECKTAELTFVHRRSNARPHLRRIPSSHHLENCSYLYEYASRKQIKNYVDSLSDKQIQDKLSAIMRMLCKNHRKSNNKSGDSKVDCSLENPMTFRPKKDSNIIKSLRRKRINGWIDESDGEDLYVFYGSVKLEVEEKINKKLNEKYNLLKIYTMNKDKEWKYRTSIYRGQTKESVEKDCIYNIVMIGNLEFKYKPFSIRLANWNAIKFQEESNNQ